MWNKGNMYEKWRDIDRMTAEESEKEMEHIFVQTIVYDEPMQAKVLEKNGVYGTIEGKFEPERIAVYACKTLLLHEVFGNRQNPTEAECVIPYLTKKVEAKDFRSCYIPQTDNRGIRAFGICQQAAKEIRENHALLEYIVNRFGDKESIELVDKLNAAYDKGNRDEITLHENRKLYLKAMAMSEDLMNQNLYREALTLCIYWGATMRDNTFMYFPAPGGVIDSLRNDFDNQVMDEVGKMKPWQINISKKLLVSIYSNNNFQFSEKNLREVGEERWIGKEKRANQWIADIKNNVKQTAEEERISLLMFAGKAHERYVANARRGLSECLGCQPYEIGEVLLERWNDSTNPVRMSTIKMAEISGFTSASIKKAERITEKGIKKLSSVMDKVTDKYYTDVLFKCLETMSDKEIDQLSEYDIKTMPKRFQYREDINALIAIVSSVLFSYVLMDWYAEATNQSLQKSEDKKRTVSILERKLKESEDRNKALTECLRQAESEGKELSRKENKNANRTAMEAISKAASLERDLEKEKKRTKDLEEELAYLKEIIEGLDQEIQNRKPDPAYKPTEADLAGKKVLFVCDEIESIYPDLPERLPECMIAENENDPLPSVEPDLVVFVIRHISHPMYYKVKKRYPNAKRLYFTGKNIGKMIEEAAEILGVAA